MKKIWVHLLMASTLLAGSVSAASGVESVQLQPVALDASLDCNRILFQSSQSFKQTLFAIPRIDPGTGIEGSRTYNITPTQKAGQYQLAVSFYFPANDEVLKKSFASTYKKDIQACNWDKVKYFLNKNISDPNQMIKTISMIPLTSIEVRLQGLAPVAYIGGNLATNENSDILDYNGKSLTAFFLINETEKNIFQSQLVSAAGIKAFVKFQFKARSRNGSVKAKIDLGKLAENFSAAASAKGLKVLGSADLTATLKSSISENSVQITSEAGSTDDVSKITQILMDKILKEIDLSLKDIQITDADKAKAGTGQISVAVVAQILKSKISSEISVQLVSAPETASALVEKTLIADRLNDPNIIETSISAGYSDPSIGLIVNAGQSISISPAYWYLDKIDYVENRQFLTTSEIQTLNLATFFEDLLNPSMTIQNIEVNGTLLAEGKWSLVSDLHSPSRFRWARFQNIARRIKDSSNTIASNLETFNALPLQLTFSELGDTRQFKFSDLSLENPFWTATYDDLTGRMILTAKQNLGNIRLRERMHGDENIKYAKSSIILDQVRQQKINFFGNHDYSAPFILKQDAHAIIEQKTIVLKFTRPRVMTASELKHIKVKAAQVELMLQSRRSSIKTNLQ